MGLGFRFAANVAGLSFYATGTNRIVQNSSGFNLLRIPLAILTPQFEIAAITSVPRRLLAAGGSDRFGMSFFPSSLVGKPCGTLRWVGDPFNIPRGNAEIPSDI
jgi:hypothetical protein